MFAKLAPVAARQPVRWRRKSATCLNNRLSGREEAGGSQHRRQLAQDLRFVLTDVQLLQQAPNRLQHLDAVLLEQGEVGRRQRRLAVEVGVQLGHVLGVQSQVLRVGLEPFGFRLGDLVVGPDHLQKELHQLQAVVARRDAERRLSAHVDFGLTPGEGSQETWKAIAESRVGRVLKDTLPIDNHRGRADSYQVPSGEARARFEIRAEKRAEA